MYWSLEVALWLRFVVYDGQERRDGSERLLDEIEKRLENK